MKYVYHMIYKQKDTLLYHFSSIKLRLWYGLYYFICDLLEACGYHISLPGGQCFKTVEVLDHLNYDMR